MRLKPGKSIPVGISVDTRQTTDETLLSSVTIHANSDGAGGGSGTDQGEDDIVPSLLNPGGSDSDRGTTSSDETSMLGSLFPGGDGVQLLSDGSNDDSSTPTPRSAPTPSDGSESTPSDGEGVPCSAPGGPDSTPERCDPTPDGNTTLDTDHPAVLVAGGVVVISPADEAAVAGLVVFGGFVIAVDQVSKHLGDSTGGAEVEQEKEENNEADQQNEENQDNSGRQKPNPPKRPPPDVGTLIPDGGQDSGDNPQDTEINSPAHDNSIILNSEYYDGHMGHQEDHLDKQQIRDVVGDPDKVYKGGNSRGKTVYVWVQYKNGVVHYVRSEDFSESKKIPLEGNRVRSAYKNDKDKLTDLKKSYDLDQIW